jgi:threonine/homoserine/homoserine lactone efflux protein
MGDAIGDVLPLALGVAISPIPIIAVILVLFSRRARVNGPMFLLGWIIGLVGVGVVVIAVVGGDSSGDPADPSTFSSVVKLAAGVLLLLFGVKQWRERPAPGTEASMPKWMTTIDAFTPVKAFGTGVVLAAANPKNLLLTVGAGATIAAAELSAGDAAVTLAVFVVLGSVTIAGPVLLALFGGEKVGHLLDGWKAWLGLHNAAVMAVLFVVFGVVLIGKAVGGFST